MSGTHVLSFDRENADGEDVNVIIPLAIFVSVVCCEFGVFIETIFVGLADHTTIEPAAMFGRKYGFEVVQKDPSPEIVKLAVGVARFKV